MKGKVPLNSFIYIYIYMGLTEGKKLQWTTTLALFGKESTKSPH